ncbi:TetR/AcrR family transcriptional regulator [Arachnia propionica]|uniref:TetR/AcrR family transcriptional regulator n=1 Tax=Arachnia propionica TaxID=1750 RepID=UPI0013520E0E|nr:TetR family transcriptional regulator C-terminal domain-containing protein [Arachnia propionica]QUC13639.1 TetR family transcriptional regulator C-terminal domain-containing protein [Arachnia propionica]
MPKLVDHDVRRREIAQAVWAVIAERGIEGVTLRSVAAEAGVSVGRIQHYYASREELVRDSCRELLKAATQRFEAVDDTTPVEKLRRLVLGRIPATPEFAIGTSIWLAYEAKSVDDPVIAELVQRGHAGGVQEAAALLSECGVADASAVALRLMATAEGLAIRVLVGGLEPRGATELLENLIAEVLPG